jgi:hypothetical protein
MTEDETLNPTQLESLNSELHTFSVNLFVNSSAQESATHENISSFAYKMGKA